MIKIKISITCVCKEYKVKIKIAQVTKLKMKFLLGYNNPTLSPSPSHPTLVNSIRNFKKSFLTTKLIF